MTDGNVLFFHQKCKGGSQYEIRTNDGGGVFETAKEQSSREISSNVGTVINLEPFFEKMSEGMPFDPVYHREGFSSKTIRR